MFFLEEYNKIDLNKTEQDVFKYLCLKMKLNKLNVVDVKIDDMAIYMPPKPISKSSITRALSTLHRNKLIKRTVRVNGQKVNGRYVLNPRYVLKGFCSGRRDFIESFDSNKWFEYNLI